MELQSARSSRASRSDIATVTALAALVPPGLARPCMHASLPKPAQPAQQIAAAVQSSSPASAQQDLIELGAASRQLHIGHSRGDANQGRVDDWRRWSSQPDV